MRSGLRKKILFPTLLVIAVGLLTVLLVFHLHARTVVQQELAKRLQREVQLTAKLLDKWLLARVNDVRLWSGQEVFVEALTEEGYYGRSARQGARQLLATLQQGYPFYENIFLASRDGEVKVHGSMELEDGQRIQLGDRP